MPAGHFHSPDDDAERRGKRPAHKRSTGEQNTSTMCPLGGPSRPHQSGALLERSGLASRMPPTSRFSWPPMCRRQRERVQDVCAPTLPPPKPLHKHATLLRAHSRFRTEIGTRPLNVFLLPHRSVSHRPAAHLTHVNRRAQPNCSPAYCMKRPPVYAAGGEAEAKRALRSYKCSRQLPRPARVNAAGPGGAYEQARRAARLVVRPAASIWLQASRSTAAAGGSSQIDSYRSAERPESDSGWWRMVCG